MRILMWIIILSGILENEIPQAEEGLEKLIDELNSNMSFDNGA